MKVKSWKKFVKPQKLQLANRLQDDSEDESEKTEEEEEEDGESLMQRVLGENETLKALMEERNKLEKKMAELTGKPIQDKYGIKNFSYAEIPSIKVKKAKDKEEAEKRKKVLEDLKQKRDSNAGLSTNISIETTNLTPLTPPEAPTNIGQSNPKKKNSYEKKNVSPKKKDEDIIRSSAKKKNEDFTSSKKRKEEQPRSTPKKIEDEYLKKKEEFQKKKATVKKYVSGIKDFVNNNENKNLFDRIKNKKTDEWLKKHEKQIKKVKKTAKDIKKIGSTLNKTSKDLSRFSNDFKKISSNKEVSDALGSSGLMNSFDKGSKLLDKLNKPLDAIKTNKSVKAFTKNWQKAKEKQREIQKLKDRFDNNYKAKRDQLLKVEVGTINEIGKIREKLKQKALEKKKEKEEEERKREEKRKKRKAEREKERKKENKREQRREERKRRKKEKF